MKHLSSIANDVVQRCQETLGISGADVVKEFELGLEPEVTDYARKLIEFCGSKTLNSLSKRISGGINDGSFSRFTFDMMLAWETPSSSDEQQYSECVAKEKEEKIPPPKVESSHEHDDVSLFYSDIMPLLVDEERNIGEDAFFWLGSLIPLVIDVTNARFAFEALTASTAHRLYFPAYDRFLREIDKCIKYLNKQTSPTGVILAEDEFILHVEGTPMTQRVVRHIGNSSWPGKLTLTNYAIYFEASKAISYETALKIDLSTKGDNPIVKPTSTGPWGAPLFDKAIILESSELSESLILEFPELTSATRRDHWLTLIREIILLHQFFSKYKIESPLQMWDMHARVILSIVRLHSARELLRISPPAPHNFLIFTLFDELPKGDYVLEELSNGLKQMEHILPYSATSILKNLNMSHPIVEAMDVKEDLPKEIEEKTDNLISLETTICQAKEEAKEMGIAKASIEGLREEGITDSIIVLIELLGPLKTVFPWLQGILTWERPSFTLFVLFITMLIIFKQWIGCAMSVGLLLVIGEMLWLRHRQIRDKCSEIVVSTSSDQTTVESIVSAHHGLRHFKEMVQTTNITILKFKSILLSRAPKHANLVMLIMVAVAILLSAIPSKYIIMATILYCFMKNSKAKTYVSNTKGNRRLQEWWDSIPVTPIRTASKTL